MKNLFLIPALLFVAACDNTTPTTQPGTPPAPEATETPGQGGPCGDGTVLQPGTQCP